MHRLKQHQCGKHFRVNLTNRRKNAQTSPLLASGADDAGDVRLHLSPQDIIEKQRLSEYLAEKGTSLAAKKEIAASLHISLATLYRKIKKYQL